MRTRPLPLYPFLAALYSVLALAAENTEEIIAPSEVVSAAVMTLAFAGISWIASGFLAREGPQRALLAFVGVLFLSWYGFFLQAIQGVPGLSSLGREVALPLWFLILSAAAILILRRKVPPAGLTRFLNIFTAILLVFPLGTILLDTWEESRAEGVAPRRAMATDSPSAAAEPDIYLIVLDKYTGSGALATGYGYDNSAFEDSLRARGFFVPESSHSNYVHTAQALASMLNWTYLDSVAPALDSRDRTALYRMIQDNRAWRRLKAQGYEFVFFPTPYRATARNDHADLQLPEPFAPSIQFQLAWLLGTPLSPFMRWLCGVAGCEAGGARSFPYPPESAEEIEWKFRKLGELASRPGRKFVFAHLLVPHEPFIFRTDCSHRDPIWEPDVDAPDSLRAKDDYVAQIRCVNVMLLKLIDRLLTGSGRPPIIVLQADHGHGRIVIDPVHNTILPLSRLSPAQVRERTEIFAAYHFPEGGSRLLYDSITPVNVFPLILNHYFGEEIPLREDATYWVEPNRPYRFLRLR